MFADKKYLHLDNAVDLFILRAYDVFPPEWLRSLSRIERAVFNVLMGRLIHKNGYAATTDPMLSELRADMEKIVGYPNSWSRIERILFNLLVGRLVNRSGYVPIANEMLPEFRDDVEAVVGYWQ